MVQWSASWPATWTILISTRVLTTFTQDQANEGTSIKLTDQ